jgi:histidyl-tRNA synthetase
VQYLFYKLFIIFRKKMKILPKLVKGMRDYGAVELYKRNHILSVIQSVYACYGFAPLETPALEYRATLTGKYGEEGEQLVFNVLKSGNFLEGMDPAVVSTTAKEIRKYITDKGLRYDLTVPLARYIAANQHQLLFPFRRYQIQPVWRADRPQKGRYREFLQCDADIIGSTSLVCEAEMLQLIYDVFTRLRIRDAQVKVSHRGILSAVSGAQEGSEAEKTFCMVVDKMEKVGFDAVSAELSGKGFSTQAIASFASLAQLQGTNVERLTQLQTVIGGTERGAKALALLTECIKLVQALGAPDDCFVLEPTLARGLAYYTGLVMEATIVGAQVGSVGGGGRYDKLGTLFGGAEWSGIGFSFGIDRLYDVMECQGLFDAVVGHTTEVLLLNMDVQTEAPLLLTLSQLRAAGFKAEMYPERAKLKKQFAYADKKKIPFVLILGEEELAANAYGLKHMETSRQKQYTWSELCMVLRKMLNETK